MRNQQHLPTFGHLVSDGWLLTSLGDVWKWARSCGQWSPLVRPSPHWTRHRQFGDSVNRDSAATPAPEILDLWIAPVFGNYPLFWPANSSSCHLTFRMACTGSLSALSPRVLANQLRTGIRVCFPRALTGPTLRITDPSTCVPPLVAPPPAHGMRMWT